MAETERRRQMEREFIRLLKANEIECRISTINAKGLSLLLYKDARVDQRILDESVGPFGWQRSHQCIDGSLYCTVSVWNEGTNEWISKQDVGTMGYAEKEKSQASDSFKRACFNWGIGRELYTAPFIWIPADKVKIQLKDNKYTCYEHFQVSSIAYNKDREIEKLVITNDKGVILYELKETRKPQENPDSSITTLSKGQMEVLQSELKRTGISMDAVKDRYKIAEPEAMGNEIYNKVISALKKTKNAA